MTVVTRTFQSEMIMTRYHVGHAIMYLPMFFLALAVGIWQMPGSLVEGLLWLAMASWVVGFFIRSSSGKW